MNLVCVGLNHKICPVEIREKAAFPASELESALAEMKHVENIREGLILSTCNRVELYGRGGGGMTAGLVHFLAGYHGLAEADLESYLYRYYDTGAARHLFRVASGLDSMVVGESEIYAQVRHAFQTANRAHAIDSIMYQLMERALRVGKRVRTETRINEGAVSVSSIAVELAQKIFGKLTGERVLVLGTGKMSERTMKHLIASGAGEITITTRTYENALEFARRFGARPLVFKDWPRALRASDIVISSTSAPRPIIQYEDVKAAMAERRHRPLFFVDIAVPRDIDPRAGDIDDVYLYNIDDLKAISAETLRKRKKEVLKCEAMIEREVESFSQWHAFLEAGPTIQKLNSYFDEIVERELNKINRKFKGREKEVEALTSKIKASLLHAPIEGLKESAKNGSIERYLEVLQTLFRLDDQAAHDQTAAEKKPGNSPPLSFRKAEGLSGIQNAEIPAKNMPE